MRDARNGLRSIADRLTETDDGLVDLARRAAPVGEIPARLLPAFDPYLVGWTDRSFAVPDDFQRVVHPGGGILRPTVTSEGLAVGTWAVRRRRSGATIGVEPFRPLPAEVSTELAHEAADIGRFEGLHSDLHVSAPIAGR